MDSLKKFLIVCGVVAGTVFSVIVVRAYLELNSWAAGPPDHMKPARSAAAQAADQKVAAHIDSRISQLRAALPWATYLGTHVVDFCKTDQDYHGTVPGDGGWYPVTCSRAETVYEAFDGDFRQRVGQLDAVLGAAGWHPGTSGMSKRPGDQPGLVSALDYLHEPAPGYAKKPSAVAMAAALPNVANVRYTVPITEDYAEPAPDPMLTPSGGVVEVAQAPHLPSLAGGQTPGEAFNDPAFQAFYDNGPEVAPQNTNTIYYRAWEPFTSARVAAAYPAHGAIVAIRLAVNYGTGG